MQVMLQISTNAFFPSTVVIALTVTNNMNKDKIIVCLNCNMNNKN